MSDFDKILWRPIRPGKEFDKLLPVSKCQKTFVGEGYTDFSVNQMQEVVEEYSWQASELALALEKDTLQETARAVHEFLYNHFQYKADDADQMLRSLACSWASRLDGIDCKSYSIAASSLLTEMGISHYIRRIKQPAYEPTEYTHVYVIVPFDQQRASLSQGYYTIDGTISTMNEPPFVAKDDLFMSGLKHYALNGTADNGSLGFSWGDAFSLATDVASGNVIGAGGTTLDLLKDVGEKLDNLFPSLMHGIKCLDRSAFDGSELKKAKEAVTSYYSDLVDEMNSNLKNNNSAGFSQNVAEYSAASKMLVAGYEKKLSDKNWNGCSSDNLKAMRDYAIFFRDSGTKALNAYLEAYFTRPSAALNAFGDNFRTLFYQNNVTNTANTATRSVAFEKSIFNGYATWVENTTPDSTTVTYNHYTPKQATIPQFQLTDYVAKNKSNFTAADYLKTLSKVVDTVYHNGASGEDPNNAFSKDANAKQAGFGAAGWLLLAAGVSVAFSKMKDTGAGAKISKTANKPKTKPTVKNK